MDTTSSLEYGVHYSDEIRAVFHTYEDALAYAKRIRIAYPHDYIFVMHQGGPFGEAI